MLMTTAAKPRRGKTEAEPLLEIAPEAAAALEAYLTHLSDVRRRSEYTIRNYRTDLEDYLRFLAPKGGRVRRGRAVGWARVPLAARGHPPRRGVDQAARHHDPRVLRLARCERGATARPPG